MKPSRKKEFIELVPINEEMVSPEEVIAVIAENKAEIKSVRYQPPLRIGSDDFGAFRVEWKTLKYQKVNLDAPRLNAFSQVYDRGLGRYF